MALTIIVNGTTHQWQDRAGLTLLELLRDDLGVTGPKLGCGEGACGACTVLVGSKPVQACQVMASENAGERITTVEGLAEDDLLHPVQQAWLETGALQCGFCTPGWLTATAGLLTRTTHPDDDKIAAELAGHVCRCCTYPRIRAAVHRAAELMELPDQLESVSALTASSGQDAAIAPEVPWDLGGRQPDSFAAAMPDGLMTVVAGDGDATTWGAPDEAWVHVGSDGAITAYTGKVEAGQGTRTALALLVAEELAVGPSSVALSMARTDSSPFDLGTFGSRSMPHAAPPLRAAAAGAFRLLRESAAAKFGLSPDAVTASGGIFAGPDGAPNASYGELVAGQRRVERVPADEPVRGAADWRAAGRRVRAARSVDAVTGAKKFPSDLRIDGMLHGAVVHPPSAGAELISADTGAAEAIAGVTVVRQDGVIGVVAAAESQVRGALSAIKADWREKTGPVTAQLESYLRERPSDGDGRWGPFRHNEGDVAAAFTAGPVRVEASYKAAYVAHVPLEPRAALARWSGDELVVWTATSTPFRARGELAKALDIAESGVHVIVPDFGGGFGGKHGSAVALEAARLARAVGCPVKVQWSRADEFTAGYLRPAAVIDVAASADASGKLTSWSLTNINSGAAGIMTPYRVPSQAIAYQPAAAPLAQGSYRALAATANNFARESLMDELASELGADPVQFRLQHLDDQRLAAALTTAATEIGWDKGKPAADDPHGQIGRGIALGIEKDGRVATAARVRVAADGTLEILALVTAVDCGAVVHPNGLSNQVEGATMMGLGPALFEQIELSGSRILNGSMSDYRVPRLADLPLELRVVLLDRPRELPVGGGETPIIAVAPAIANAIFHACGIRLRAMPLVPGGRVPGLRPS